MQQTPSGSAPTLDDVPAAVERQLNAFLNQVSPPVAEIGAPVANAVGLLRDFVLGGGKRIRPTFGWVGYTAAGGLEKGEEDPRAVLRAVSALEFIQACALIHDDIIDASDTRRGNPTVHRAAAANHRSQGWHGDAEVFGQNVAILIGDLALVWADDMWHGSGLSTAARDRAHEPWRGMRSEVIGGQILDISLEAASSESEELANAVNVYKTAAYTIERPLHLGAAVAGADETTITALRGYGRDIGVAYQLRDDLLGVFGDPEVTGKPAGDDLREGKRTVLYSLALRAADQTDPVAAEKLRSGIGVVQDPKDIAELTAIIEGTGAVEDVEKRIAHLTETGLSSLNHAQLDHNAAEALKTMAEKATARRM
ncbi:polyprenyl synthetase family protein [Corynebacterium tuscaniense]|uniref:polyprenyl synthetase family protein n=1 Tax=Corynebacterium tuscaniense TaxID=302449 RepID=UPI00050EBF6C|nr:polyprenyl synthetase family protein [Corynebacterium tuscaniense]KGF24995.1 geranylgeranyl pyrophosphate synthase [Corynebacterium tuscaniense DNF00037]